ncbi:hypothetical protein [Paraburkholderia youngii]|uniref:hypothetical protein n=1 Tax=Paraburkholderia youngii TaxID=2782701 RepID=UPI003D1DF68F
MQSGKTDACIRDKGEIVRVVDIANMLVAWNRYWHQMHLAEVVALLAADIGTREQRCNICGRHVRELERRQLRGAIDKLFALSATGYR